MRQASFVGHTCGNHARQRYVTTGGDKGVCNRGWGRPATKRGFESQPYTYLYIYIYPCLYAYVYTYVNVFFYLGGSQAFLRKMSLKVAGENISQVESSFVSAASTTAAAAWLSCRCCFVFDQNCGVAFGIGHETVCRKREEITPGRHVCVGPRLPGHPLCVGVQETLRNFAETQAEVCLRRSSRYHPSR